MEAITKEEQALSALRPSVSLTTEERAAIANWNSDPPIYPQLTEEECDELVKKARFLKGQSAYKVAYNKKINGVREFPVFTAKTFREFVVARGTARAQDLHWESGKFDVDADNQAILKILSLYFTRDPRFVELGYSLHKGIFLSGGTGVGKTILMQLCSVNPLASYAQDDCQVITEAYAAKTGGSSVIDHYSTNTAVANSDLTFGHTVLGRFFDDLGQESNARHFGNERNVMGDIIENRYRAGGYHLTHFTSNHTVDELAALYGPRPSDRIHEMCNIIEYPATAKSRRRRPSAPANRPNLKSA